MKSPFPRIAIPEPTSADAAYNQRSLPQYVRAVEAAGGVAVPISLREALTAQTALIDSCAGVLLPGSPADIDPARYGQQAIKECAARDAAREAADEFLLQEAFLHAKPVLGICYGLQSLNVWRQGTLIQDLPQAELGTGNMVDHEPGRDVQSAHPVDIAPGSRLSRILSDTLGDQPELFVNSSHHQAVARAGEDLVVAATSPVDGVIEALEVPDAERFVVGVQWHPERSYETSTASRGLFAAFLDAARAWASPADGLTREP